jgi:nucleoside-diphosphate-sugar epimerase
MGENQPKKILITGKESYIGTSFEKWLKQWPEQYEVDTISVKDVSWKNVDFSKYDALFHVAGIVHQKEKPAMRELYFKVNRNLAVEIAKKAKLAGVEQFVFMSSMSVYGLEGKIGEPVVITRDTPCKPNTFYGQSKYEAEQELQKLEDESFKVAIIRAPMIYGPNCPGNYARLRKLVLKVSVFPLIENERSMLFINNFNEFIRLMLERKSRGLFFPQNKKYSNITELVRLIAKENYRKIIFLRSLAVCIKSFGKHLNLVNKVFGNLVYDTELSSFADFWYNVTSLEESVHECEIGI